MNDDVVVNFHTVSCIICPWCSLIIIYFVYLAKFIVKIFTYNCLPTYLQNYKCDQFEVMGCIYATAVLCIDHSVPLSCCMSIKPNEIIKQDCPAFHKLFYSSTIFCQQNVKSLFSSSVLQYWPWHDVQCTLRTFPSGRGFQYKHTASTQYSEMFRLNLVKSAIFQIWFFWCYSIRNDVSRVDLIIKVVIEFLSDP